jgi:hypothetical protein
MSIGGFFKKILGVIPLLNKLIDNPVIRIILVSKFGQQIVDLISHMIDALDVVEDMTNKQKHASVKERARAEAVAAGMSESELDTHIHMLVKQKRGTARVVVSP